MTQQHQIPQPRLSDPFKQPRKPSKLWILLAAITLGVLGAGAWGLGLTGSTPPATHTVVYAAEADSAYGSGRTGMVTAQAPGGSIQQTGLLPITGTYTDFHSGDFVYLSVQNQQSVGSVTCRITVDGVVVSENTSSGGYTIATCQGRVR